MRNKNYEKSPLSLEPGGDTIKITFRNGEVRIYTNIKNVSAYVAKVLKESEKHIEKIELEKQVEVIKVTTEWRPLFGRSVVGTIRNYDSQWYNY